MVHAAKVGAIRRGVKEAVAGIQFSAGRLARWRGRRDSVREP
jgi:hypothetical protein